MSTTAEQLAAVARDAGITAHVHARRLGGPDEPEEEVAWEPDVLVSTASLYKLPLALVWADLVERGDLDPVTPIALSARDRMNGPTGVAMLSDDVTLSPRDAVRLMLTISDNACGDAVLDQVGLDRAQRHLGDLGLPAGLVRQGSAAETEALLDDTGASTWAAAQRVLADPDRLMLTSQYDPALASAASARDLTAVLALLWSRPGAAHALVRDALLFQAWRHRLGSGFPHDDVALHAKTGSLGSLRHEAAVVRFPGEHPVAVAVLTRSARPERHLPRVEAAIGELARLAVLPLRLAQSTRSSVR